MGLLTFRPRYISLVQGALIINEPCALPTIGNRLGGSYNLLMIELLLLLF